MTLRVMNGILGTTTTLRLPLQGTNEFSCDLNGRDDRIRALGLLEVRPVLDDVKRVTSRN
jgi:hypothetical protein